MPSPQLLSNTKLLQRFHATGSSEAFRELVRRFSGFVLAAARRHTGGDWHAAEDIAQHVFSALAQHAKQVRGETLGAWLYRRTVFLANNHKRQERRREARERLAAADSVAGGMTEAQGLPEGFDEAFGRLTMDDQQLLLWRYIEKQDFRTIGNSLGISDDAAQKRTSRALELLRAALAKRGVVYGSSALSSAMLAATTKDTVSATQHASWCEGALQSTKAASWTLAGLAIPAACLLIGAAVPVAIMPPAATTPSPAIVSTGGAGANQRATSNLRTEPPAVVDLAALTEFARKSAESPLWMARFDQAVNELSGNECRALMEELGYLEEHSAGRRPGIIRKKVAARWCEAEPRVAAVKLNLGERALAYRIIGAENLGEAEQMIAALPEGDAKLERVGFDSAQNGLWRAAVCGLAAKDLAAALEQVDQGADRLGLEWRKYLKHDTLRDSAETNPEQTVRIVGKMVDQSFLAEALGNLAKSNARLAADLLGEFPVNASERIEVERKIFEAMLKQDKVSAIRLAPSLLGSRAISQVHAVAAALYQDGFEEAWAGAGKIQSAEFREALQRKLGNKLAVENPSAAMAKFSNRDSNPGTRQLWWSAFINFARKDPTAALAVKFDSSTPPSFQLQDVALAIAGKDTDVAMKWLAALPESFKEAAATSIRSVAEMRQTQDPKMHAQAVMTNTDAKYRCAELTPTLAKWYEKSPGEAQQFAESLSGPERAAAFCGVIQAVSPGVVGGSEVAKPILAEFAKTNSSLDANSMFGVTKFVENWVKQEPDQASEWINALPRGQLFDQAARGIAEGLRLTDPRDALTWVTAIADPKLRDGVANWILQDWSMVDSDDARSAVEALSVSSEVKAAFIKHIRPTQ